MHPTTLTRRLLAVAAGAAIGISGAIAVASSEDSPRVVSCPASEADLLRAADAARILEAQRPDLFDGTPRADYHDLRLAAEWARRLAALDPSRPACTTG
jgi:hypothetical protein